MYHDRGHADVVLSVSFSPDGKRVVSGSNDTLVKIWNAETGQEGARTRSSYPYPKSWNVETGLEVSKLVGERVWGILMGHAGEVTAVAL
ncbi:hypothetical protein T484DRAFT_1820690 [Baffinella frigidus]|nr:hypothetical protein T484DRAFT_1820690 [Cryptophyta sp. CCMP2293]